MTASSLSPFTVLALILAVSSAPAMAQTDGGGVPGQATGAPRQLPGAPGGAPGADDSRPMGALNPDGGPSVDIPSGTATPNPPANDYSPATLAPVPGVLGHGGGAIEVGSLGTVEGPPVGLMDASNGGLGEGLWTGSERGVIADLMGRMPAASPVSAVRNLSRRVLLTKAAYPVGQAAHAISTLRLQKLMQAGLLNDAGILAANMSVKNDAEFARVQADAILYAGHGRDACSDATAARLDYADPFWIELRAYCYAATGDDAAYDLTRAVMDAQSIDHAAFDTLVDDAINHKTVDPGSIDDPNSLYLFLMGQAGIPVSADIAAKMGTPANVLAMHSEKNSIADRARAANVVMRAGAASSQELLALADALTFKPDDLANASQAAPSLPLFEALALLRQAARAEKAPPRKLALVHQALRLGMRNNAFEPAAVLMAGPAAAIVPDKSMRDDADMIARALLTAGKADIAANWFGAYDANDDRDRAMVALLQAELGLVAPNPANTLQAQDGLNWLADNTHNIADPALQARAGLVLGVYAALGVNSASHVAETADELTASPLPGRRPAGAVMARITGAMGAPDRKGEAILGILNAVGAKGPGDLAPDVTIGFVGDLLKMGVPHAARELTIAALLQFVPQRPPAPTTASAPP